MEENAIVAFIQSVPSELPLAGLLALVIVSLVKGWLLPRSHLLDLRADYAAQLEAKDQAIRDLKESYDQQIASKDKQIEDVREDRDARLREIREDCAARIEHATTETRDWREVARANEAALAVVRSQNGELLEVARTADHVLRSTFGTPPPPSPPRQIGEADARA